MVLSLAGATLLVGIDFSGHCERALLRAVALAEKNEAQIELVHVFEWADSRLPRAGAASPRPDRVTDLLWEQVVAQADATRGRLGQICSSLVGDRASARIRVVIGEPAPMLLHAAERAGASLIVLGSQGRRALPHGMLGTTADRVGASSVIPVLLVPGPGPERNRASSS